MKESGDSEVSIVCSRRRLGELVFDTRAGSRGGIDEKEREGAVTEPISIGALATLVKELVGTTSPIVFVPYDQAYEAGFEDMESRVPDIRKLPEQLTFEPQLTLRQIILDVAEYQ